jgi:hypothetical protein
MVNKKEKSITFRVEEGLFIFLKEFAISNKIVVSEMVRNILIYFMMGYLMGDFKKTLPELQEEFIKHIETKNKGKKKVQTSDGVAEVK